MTRLRTRRSVLAAAGGAVASAWFAGADGDAGYLGVDEPLAGTLRATFHPDGDGRFTGRESVELWNLGERSVPLTGRRLRYDDGRTHVFGRTSLVPGARAFVVTRGNRELHLASSPPVHVLGAGFEDPALADGRATVVLVSRAGHPLFRTVYRGDGE